MHERLRLIAWAAVILPIAFLYGLFALVAAVIIACVEAVRHD